MAKKSHSKSHVAKIQVEKSAPKTGKASQQSTDLADLSSVAHVEKPATTGVFQDQEAGQSSGGTALLQPIQTTPLDDTSNVRKLVGEEAIRSTAVQAGKSSLKADVRPPAAAPMSEPSTPEKAEKPVRTAETVGSVQAAAETAAPPKSLAAKPIQEREWVSLTEVNKPIVAQEAVSKPVSPSDYGFIEPQEDLSEAATPKGAPAEKLAVPPETPVAAGASAEELVAALETEATAAQGSIRVAETVTVPSVENVREVEEPAKPSAEPCHEEPPYFHPPLDNKYLNKEALRHRFLLRQEFKPIISYVGRLEQQKGVPLIRHGVFFALAHGAQFVLLGTSPEPRINAEFWHLKRQLNDNPDCHLELGYHEELAHLIYAGSDMMIMPSLYEPCGLTQMIALKYGTVPIVRAVGGLADTVFDRDYSDKPYHERNGYVFYHAEAADLESALRRAIGLWYSYPEEFRQLIINGMKYDYSWYHSAQHYLNIYEYIRCKQS